MAYDASSIQILEGLEPVRLRPGMYIGGTGSDGFHHLLWEIVDNSVDEAMNGHASHVDIKISSDGTTATVTDNGRGIPVDIHPVFNKPALELLLTTLHSGSKFDGKSYANSGGLHGVGSSVVNALSSEMIVTVKRDGGEWRMQFKQGRVSSPMEQIGTVPRATGTTVTFTPDPEIFGALRFDVEKVRERLETMAFLHKGLKLRLTYEKQTEEFCYPEGIKAFIMSLAKRGGKNSVQAEPFFLEKKGEVRIEAAILFTDGIREQVASYANGITTSNGGTHEQGAKDALVKAIRTHIETHELTPKGVTITPDDIREGAIVVVSVFLREPQFQGQTKDKLNNPEMKSIVEGLLRTPYEQYLNANRTAADQIVARVIQAARARLARASADDQIRRKSPTSGRLNLPGKLADCSSTDPKRCELFVVEGDSAGGSAKQGRDREFQAILPLRGKVLNTERATLAKVLANEELTNVVSALGCGVGPSFDINKLRYCRLILLMDADHDGSHIATLLLTFFFRHMPEMIKKGHLFIAQPPLYRIDSGQQTWWAADETDRDKILKRVKGKPEITRFKGLGEMPPKTLYETTLDPRKRKLLKVTIPDGSQVGTDQMISDLMGNDPVPRLREIMSRLGDVEGLDT